MNSGKTATHQSNNQARQHQEMSLKDFQTRLEQVIDHYANMNGKSKRQALAAAGNIVGKLVIKYGE